MTEAIKYCHQISPYRVEISAPHHFQALEELKKVLNNFRNSGFSLTLHNYFPAPIEPFVLNMAASDELGEKNARNLVNNALELCTAIGSPLYGIHAGYLSNPKQGENEMFTFDDQISSYSEALKRSVKFVNKIAPNFEKAGVRLLIENLFPSINNRHSLFCTIDEIREFSLQIPKSVGLLLDLGHLNVSSNILGFERHTAIENFLEEFSDRLFEVHLSENKGLKDEHLAIKKGSWQLEALKGIQQQKLPFGETRVYCVEARNASIKELHASIDLVNEIIS